MFLEMYIKLLKMLLALICYTFEKKTFFKTLEMAFDKRVKIVLIHFYYL